MTKDVLSCRAEDSVDMAERLMRDGQVRRVPVVDDERRPIGIVAVNDLARASARGKKSRTDRQFVQTLAAICQHRSEIAEGHSNNLVGMVF